MSSPPTRISESGRGSQHHALMAGIWILCWSEPSFTINRLPPSPDTANPGEAVPRLVVTMVIGYYA